MSVATDHYALWSRLLRPPPAPVGQPDGTDRADRRDEAGEPAGDDRGDRGGGAAA